MGPPERRLRIASWNIAGGRPLRSSGHFDYLEEDLSYFASELARLRPDVVCLQESQVSQTRSLAVELAGSSGMQHVFDTPISPSHIDEAYQLSLAIIANCPFLEQAFFAFPDPDFPLFWPSGERASVHRKGLQVVDVQGCRIGNTHLHPLGLWGRSYCEGQRRDSHKGLGSSSSVKPSAPSSWPGTSIWTTHPSCARACSQIWSCGMGFQKANEPHPAPSADQTTSSIRRS